MKSIHDIRQQLALNILRQGGQLTAIELADKMGCKAYQARQAAKAIGADIIPAGEGRGREARYTMPASELMRLWPVVA